jgi:prepilin-type N-terminal cleavage/methylation domain-containing protein
MTRHRTGFTLLELLVVLVVLAITAVAAVPAFLSGARGTPEHQAATVLAAALVQTRNAARESGASATFVLSPADGRYWITTRDSATTGTVPLAGAVTLIAGGQDRTACRFQPWGPATPFVITVRATTTESVHVDSWSGEIGISDAPRS